MRLHHRNRTIAFRLVFLFISSIVGVFSLINVKAYLPNLLYDIAPNFFSKRATLSSDAKDSIWLLPLSADRNAHNELKQCEADLSDNAQLVINKIGVNAKIQFNIPPDAKVMYKSLESGLVHYSESPKPGRPGLAIILGHSSYYSWYKGDYGWVFALLGKLAAGDRVSVQYSDGKSIPFIVRESFILDPNKQLDDPRVDRIAQKPDPGILLLGSWPIGTAYTKIAIYGQFDRTTAATAALSVAAEC